LRPSLLAICKGTCCGCYSSLICPTKFTSTPSDTSAPPAIHHEMRRLRTCRRCHHGYHDDQDNGIPDAGTVSDVSEKCTGRELVVLPGGDDSNRVTNNLNSPFGSASMSLHVNHLDVPTNGSMSGIILTTTCSPSTFTDNRSRHHKSYPPPSQKSLSTTCFSCNVCQRHSLSDESESVTKTSERQQTQLTSQQKASNIRVKGKRNTSNDSMSDNTKCKRIWRHRNHHACHVSKKRETGNYLTTPGNNNDVNTSLSEGSSGGSSCSSSRGDWKHHQHHIKCHYGRSFARTGHRARGNHLMRQDLTLTSL